jgi:small subunit ribosomal protein S1
METEVQGNLEGAEINELSDLKRKMKLTGTVVKTTLAGALVDIGIDVPGVVHISQLQAEPVNRVEDVVQTGDQVQVWVRRVFPKKNRVELTMIEPLKLEWREISKDMVVQGKVTRLEKFGAFVDIGSERPGLVHISEITHDYIKSPDEVLREGEEVEVKVLSVNPKRKQIKLSIKALMDPPEKVMRDLKKQTKKSEPTVKEEPVPTAMEMALREAMERNKDTDEEPIKEIAKSKNKKPSSEELENILARTLDQRR